MFCPTIPRMNEKSNERSIDKIIEIIEKIINLFSWIVAFIPATDWLSIFIGFPHSKQYSASASVIFVLQ